MSLRLRLDPSRVWSARLPWSPMAWEMIPPPEDVDDSGLVTALDIVEERLWNEVLSRQDASGRFWTADGDLDVESPRVVEALIRSAVIHALPSTLTIALPMACRILSETEDILWRIRTSYPQHGSMAISYFGKQESPCMLRVRVPTAATDLQVIRSGNTITPDHDTASGFLMFPGPWRTGDAVDVCFGLPITVVKPDAPAANRRFYPGAPPITGAFVRHGVRDLIPWPQHASDMPKKITVGVRKDGVLMLLSCDANVPLGVPGDAFSTADKPAQRLVARSLARSLGLSPCPEPYDVEMGVFATNFDRGA